VRLHVGKAFECRPVVGPGEIENAIPGEHTKIVVLVLVERNRRGPSQDIVERLGPFRMRQRDVDRFGTQSRRSAAHTRL
jgi:hypothetical protein